MYGRIGIRPAMWSRDEGCCFYPASQDETSNLDLIPPKREPRTVEVYIDWQNQRAYGSCPYTEHSSNIDEKCVLIHPNDREPITKKDIFDRLTGHTASVCAENVLNLLKERGYE